MRSKSALTLDCSANTVAVVDREGYPDEAGALARDEDAEQTNLCKAIATSISTSISEGQHGETDRLLDSLCHTIDQSSNLRSLAAGSLTAKRDNPTAAIIGCVCTVRPSRWRCQKARH